MTTAIQSLKLGRFFIDSGGTYSHPPHLQKLFGEIYIVEAKQAVAAFGHYSPCIEYVGVFKDFDELKQGDLIPTYLFEFEKRGDNIECLSVKKVTE